VGVIPYRIMVCAKTKDSSLTLCLCPLHRSLTAGYGPVPKNDTNGRVARKYVQYPLLDDRAMTGTAAAPLVGVVMGSRSDWETMTHAAEVLEELGVPHEVRVVSAHRTPDLLFRYAEEALGRGIQVIIAGAGGAAHLPGMLAAKTRLPVLGVPVQSKALNGMDSLLSIAQMPAGIPVGTLAIGRAGAVNAGLLAASVLALHNPALAVAVEGYRARQTQTVLDNPDPRS
jgi:5-(carboxyamino)imidazole ribonucleotide mutase